MSIEYSAKQGLTSILANSSLDNNAPTEEKEEMLKRTRVFYFNKTTGNTLTLEEVKSYEQSSSKKTPSQPSELTTSLTPATALEPAPASEQAEGDEEPRVLTFAELKELIESGRLDEIPNNKTIPNALNEASPSQSTAERRKKPWEIAYESETTDRSATSESTINTTKGQ
ncbi:hypothetical protein AN958_07344 [Leucoagaricus sp. SymC.cos]|nr:hypothetical protein AN958_07344 [Leucoagaricus sp. SymC.cos]